MKSIDFKIDFNNSKVIVKKVVEASLHDIWQIFSNGDLMALWWGPKTWPASTVSFDFKPGGHWHYYMQGPEGVRSYGWYGYVSIEEKKKIVGEDIFCDEFGKINNELPKTRSIISFTELGEETEVIFESDYESSEDLNKVVEMGFEAGFTDALDNLDNLVQKMYEK